MVRYLYIIGKGEFEISIKSHESQEKEAKKVDLVNILRPQQNKAASNPAGPVRQNQTQTKTQNLVVMGPGNLLGLEDIARISPHSYSAKCVSQTGTILKIDVEKFNTVVKII